jgi:hypothetical protein
VLDPCDPHRWSSPLRTGEPAQTLASRIEC